ncbi:MAG: hypothetical protein ACLRM9_08090 [Collinsella aerofaciens]
MLAKLALAVGATRTAAVRRSSKHFARLFQYVGIVHHPDRACRHLWSRRCRRRFVRRARCRILTLFIGYEKADGHQLPRLRVGADVDVDVILQFIMFKWTTKAWVGVVAHTRRFVEHIGQQQRPACAPAPELALGGDTPYTLDACFGSAGNAEAGGVPALIASATIVTNAELLARAEVKAT